MNRSHELIYKNAGNTDLLNLLSLPPGRVLDCGCGAGDNARILNERGWKVTGVTIDPREQEVTRAFCEEVHLADLENGIPPSIDGTFDVILASHVLEHLARPEQLLREARHLLNPGGVLAVALPNIAHYMQRVSFFRGNFDYTETGQLDRTHLRFYTYRTAIQLLERTGYELTYVDTDATLPWWKARPLLSLSVMGQIDRWVARQWPNLFGRQSLLLAQPKLSDSGG